MNSILFKLLLFQFQFYLIFSQLICNGEQSLCSKKYNEITFATTHNSYAVGMTLASNQNENILTQLNDGIRALMVDVYLYNDNTIHLCHTKCDNNLFLDAGNAVNTFSVIYSFLQDHPQEVITIIIENSTGNVPADRIYELFASSGLIQYVYTPKDGGSSTWPTLSEMISSNQKVVVFSDDLTNLSIYPWYLPYNEYITYNNYQYSSSEPWDCKRYGGQGSLFLLYHMKFTRLSDEIYIPFINGINETNAYENIDNHVKMCDGIRINYLAVDYYNYGDVIGYTTVLNGGNYTPLPQSSHVDTSSSKPNCMINKTISLILLLLALLLII